MRTPTLALAALLAIAGCSSPDDDAAPATDDPVVAEGTTSETAQDGGGDRADDTEEPVTATEAAPHVDFDTQEPVGLGEPGDLGNDLTVTVTDVARTDLTARRAGETSGPGVLVTVEVHNGAAEPVDIGGLVVNATSRDGAPAVPHFAETTPPENRTVEPGGAVTGMYAFRVPAGGVDTLVLDVHHDGSPNIVIVEVSS